MTYKVIEGSQSYHCCFSYTVVDTRKPVMIGGEHYDNQYESVCETFEEDDANLICNALNAAEQSVYPTDGGHSQADDESKPATISG